MQVDMTRPITSLTGEPIQNNGQVVTLRQIIHEAVWQPAPSDRERSGPEKAYLFALGLKANADLVDYSAEEIALLKGRIGELMTPVIVGRAFAMLDPMP